MYPPPSSSVRLACKVWVERRGPRSEGRGTPTLGVSPPDHGRADGRARLPTSDGKGCVLVRIASSDRWSGEPPRPGMDWRSDPAVQRSRVVPADGGEPEVGETRGGEGCRTPTSV